MFNYVQNVYVKISRVYIDTKIYTKWTLRTKNSTPSRRKEKSPAPAKNALQMLIHAHIRVLDTHWFPRS